MKNYLYIAVLLLLAGFFVACEKDTEPFEGPYRLTMGGGPSTVAPGTTHAYTLGDVKNPDTYTWSVEGPAEFDGSATGATVSINFISVGEVVLNVTNGRDMRTRTITVAEIEPAVTAALNGTGVLRNTVSDTVFFTFDAPLAQDPTIEAVVGDDAFSSGTLGDLVKVDAQNYYVIYTAGEGNGIPAIVLRDIVGNSDYGSITLDSAYVQLYRVDNLDPLADASYSQEAASEGAEVAVTVTFNEAVMVEGDEEYMFITFSRSGQPVVRDTLEATEDPLVYTADYVAGAGDGNVTVDLENVVDLAGNNVGIITNDDALEVDNTNPVVVGSAVDNGDDDFATINISSTEAGTGMYLILKDAETAPETVEEFMAATGVASGSRTLVNRSATVEVVLETGNYDVYFLAMDEAGNYSAITSTNLVMN